MVNSTETYLSRTVFYFHKIRKHFKNARCSSPKPNRNYLPEANPQHLQRRWGNHSDNKAGQSLLQNFAFRVVRPCALPVFRCLCGTSVWILQFLSEFRIISLPSFEENLSSRQNLLVLFRAGSVFTDLSVLGSASRNVCFLAK